MPGLSDSILINILGHAAGALVFGIFLVLLFSGRGWSGERGRRLSGLAAGLSVLWNLGSLAILIFPGLPEGVLNLIVASSFSALSLLPAVLLHVWLGDGQRPLVVSGYVLSAVAMVMHFREIRGNGAALHQVALLSITIGFLLLTAAAVAGVARDGNTARRQGAGRMAASMSLALFATSFVHFGSGHASEAWSSELVVHHAGIPLALFLLLQDHRFILLDAFVRFLANALLAAVLAWVLIQSAFRLGIVEPAASRPAPEATLLIGICMCLVFFAWLRGAIQNWLTRTVFGNAGVAAAAARIKSPGPPLNEEEYLDWAAAQVADAVRAETVEVVRQGAGIGETHALAAAEAIVPIRLMQGDSRLICFGRRRGGQRYLRGDLDALGEAAGEISAHVESLRREELARLVTQAELRALRSQINPHFLFNALNTLYGAIPREAAGARRMVLNLAEIFRYSLQSDSMLVTLSEEMQIVRAYLEIEQSRLGARLKVAFEIEEAALTIPIPVLSLQPLVENAIKHGVAQRMEPGFVRISAAVEAGELRVTVENSAASPVSAAAGAGLGLQNVRRRLEICHGPSSRLELTLNGATALVQLRIPVGPAEAYPIAAKSLVK